MDNTTFLQEFVTIQSPYFFREKYRFYRINIQFLWIYTDICEYLF